MTLTLIDYAKIGDLQGVYKALLAGESIHQTNSEGKTALHVAILSKDIHPKNKAIVIDYLLKVGSDLEARDRLGRTALHMACIAGV